MKHLAVMAACLIALTQAPAEAQAQAAEMTVKLNAAQPTGAGPAVGTVRVVETQYGLVFYPNLTGLMPGIHGFHVHENPSCAPLEKDGMMVPALAAGGHFDPLNSKHHGEPWGDGHLGDLPALYVMPDGSSTNPVLSPRLKKLSEIANRSLMVHVGGDNYSDHPAPVGGGGVRMACGVIAGPSQPG